MNGKSPNVPKTRKIKLPTADAISARMESIGEPKLAITSFLLQYRQFTEGHAGQISRNAIIPLVNLPEADRFGPFANRGVKALPKTVVIRLNGGLGTSMGLERAKSLLPAKGDLTFLDIAIGQVIRLRKTVNCDLPFVLMNSFNTNKDTMAVVNWYPGLEAGQKKIPVAFLQHKVPKIRQSDLQPVDWPEDRSLEWCPPGHGDLYLALVTSGMLERFLEGGLEYAFVSNVDNLGATVDLSILGYFAEKKLPFLMEVTDRTEADRKGGHIARDRHGRLILRELAQCPEGDEDDFQDIAKYRFFNTNNLWINLKALRSALKKHHNLLQLPPIVNRKTVDPTDAASPAVFQLETAMGAAIAVFPGAEAVRVPRTRFAPVKTTEDLLALWSDAYVLTDDMHINLAPSRHGRPPVLRLDPMYYGTYNLLKARFPYEPPSLAQCESLSIKGDIKFGQKVIFRGRVEIRNSRPGQMAVPDNAEIVGEGYSPDYSEWMRGQ